MVVGMLGTGKTEMGLFPRSLNRSVMCPVGLQQYTVFTV